MGGRKLKQERLWRAALPALDVIKRVTRSQAPGARGATVRMN